MIEESELRKVANKRTSPAKAGSAAVDTGSSTDQYLDYEVTTSGKWGKQKRRYLVISPFKCTVAFYNSNRKFKSEMYLKEIMQLEILASRDLVR